MPPRTLAALALLLLTAGAAGSEDKLILLDDRPRNLLRFTVAPDGQRLYFAEGKDYFVIDAAGQITERIPVVDAGAALAFVPLPDGTFLAAHRHANGHIALARADGTP